MEKNQTQLYSEICESSDLVLIQKYIDNVLRLRGFNTQSAQDKLLLLTEEIGELAKAIRKNATDIAIDHKKIDHYNSIEDEAADVFIVLLSLCNVLGINLYKAFLGKEKENINREWRTKE